LAEVGFVPNLDECMRKVCYEPKLDPKSSGGRPIHNPVTRCYVTPDGQTVENLLERKSVCMARHTGVDTYKAAVIDQFDTCMLADRWLPVQALPALTP
jgi:hypothetical protein